MKKIMCILAAVVCISIAAHADSITFTIAGPNPGATSGTLSFFGTVSAPVTNGGTLYLNGDNYTVIGSANIDDSPFLNNFPFSLNPGQSYTGELFDLLLPGGIQTMTYTGSFSILGGPGSSDTFTLASANFTAPLTSTATTPEPPAYLLLGTGMGMMLLLGWRTGEEKRRKLSLLIGI